LKKENISLEKTSEGIILQNGLVKLSLRRIKNIGHTQEYFARTSDGWRLICSAERDNLSLAKSSKTHDVVISQGTKPVLVPNLTEVKVVQNLPAKATIKLSGVIKEHSISVYITLKSECNYFHILVEDYIRGKSEIEYIQSPLVFIPDGKILAEYGDLDIVWVPHLRPLEEHVIADQIFRSPVVILQKKQDLAFMVPDLDVLSTHRVMKTAIDFDINGHIINAPTFSYGFKDWVVDRHVYFTHTMGEGQPIPSDGGFRNETASTLIFENKKLKYGYYLYLNAKAEPQSGGRKALDFLWTKYAKRYFLDVKPQVIPLEECARYMLDWAFRRYEDIVWQNLTINGVKCGAAVRIVKTPQRTREDTPIFSGWSRNWHGSLLRNTVWDSNIRSAFAYYYYGKKWNRQDLIKKAIKAKNFTLCAPQEKGIFPAIYVPQEDRWNSFAKMDYDNGHWELSEARRPEGHKDFYHPADASYTAFWLLKWYDRIEKDQKIIDYCTSYGDFLLGIQLPSGAVPSWIHRATFKPSPVMKESAETAASMLFLSELYRATRRKKYLKGAKKTATFIIEKIIATGKWEDFETYFSCSTLWRGKQIGKKDPHTGIYPQNDLCIQWAADGLLSLYKNTGEKELLDQGVRALDQLCMYQQVWNASFLSIPTFGGFCCQNTDAEWTDLRTGLYVLTLLDYYQATGNAEYFERGIAALRSCFTLLYIPENTITCNYLRNVQPSLTPDEYGAMWENQAHEGYDHYRVDMVNFHWFMASALASALVEEKYGGAYINIKYKHTFGIDGCLAYGPRISENEIRFTISEKLNERRKIPIVIEGLSGDNYKVKEGIHVHECLSKMGRCKFNIELEPHETKEILLV